ncbi:recombinase family protein [Streptomyces sp.]|uniref:recombinase family protein n=1 Tax=Streptomyces sp. TaxID=1931 RepID=UPI002810CD6A|nr:recombinase family protein [Streptomyces sp.]
MRDTRGLIAREYRRLSDRKGGRSVEDQGRDNELAADEQEWTLGEPYVDDGRSASRYARRRRDDFDRLVADLSSGPTGRQSAFGADILMLWESSRGSRQVGEWVSFIELCEQKRVRIWVTTHERLYDPANGRDRKALIDDAVDSEYESYKTHRRLVRTAPREAERGRPYGKAPWGLRPVYDAKTGKLRTWEADPTPAGTTTAGRDQAVRELFEILHAGHTPADATRAFAKRGYLNASGRPFQREQLRAMALRHAYAGLRYYKGTVYKGVWQALVPEPTFWAVRSMLTAADRATSPGGKLLHTVTAVLTCGRCGQLMRPKYEQAPDRPDNYRCANCGLKIAMAGVDELLIGTREEPGVLLAYLARPDIYEQLRAPSSGDPVVRQVQADLARARAERDELRAATGETLAEVRLLASSLERKEAQVLELEARERELLLPAAVLQMVQPGRDVWESWEAAPIRSRRMVARLILGPGYLGRPCVMPSTHSGRNQPAAAARIEWRHDVPAGPGTEPPALG